MVCRFAKRGLKPDFVRQKCDKKLLFVFRAKSPSQLMHFLPVVFVGVWGRSYRHKIAVVIVVVLVINFLFCFLQCVIDCEGGSA